MDPSSVDELDTPALVVDVGRLERNLERWQRYCDEVGLVNRPHVKTHKIVEIARRQVDIGARGVTCQKLGEAEVMADAGIDDVLIPYNLLGERKLERLGHLLARTSVSVSTDDAALLPGLASATARAGRELGVRSSATRACAVPESTRPTGPPDSPRRSPARRASPSRDS